jgi:hypothetical protein
MCRISQSRQLPKGGDRRGVKPNKPQFSHVPSRKRSIDSLRQDSAGGFVGDPGAPQESLYHSWPERPG